jgi:hypothetical protein
MKDCHGKMSSEIMVGMQAPPEEIDDPMADDLCERPSIGRNDSAACCGHRDNRKEPSKK